MSVNVEEILKKEEIECYFTVGEVLGRGKFATVKHITEKATGNCYAAKYLRKRNHAVNCRNTILQEAELLQELLEHRVIVDVKEVFEGNMYMIIILELCTGRDLFHSISVDPFTERETIFVLKQVIDALIFLHKKSIIHLDIKPENILLINETKLDIKLADFGLAVKLSPIEEFKRIIGTPEYVAPEVINFEPLSTASDLWSLGALTYALLCGYSPFLPADDSTDEEEVSRLVEQADILSNVSQAKYDFDDEVFNDISDNAKEFIRNLLVLNPKRRPDAEQCLRHQWLKAYNDVTLDQRHNTHSPIQSCTSSGFSDMSDISTNIGSNMSDYKAQLRSFPATPEYQADTIILEEKEPEISEGKPVSDSLDQVDNKHKEETKYDTKSFNAKQDSAENKEVELSSQKLDKTVDLSDKREKSSFAPVTSPKEERRESKYQSRLYSKRSVESTEKLPPKEMTEKQTTSVTSEADQKQQSDGSVSDGKRRNTKGMRRKNERSDTNIFFGTPGIPFKRSDYLAEGSQSNENTVDEKEEPVVEEPTVFETPRKTAKTPDKKETLSSTRSLITDSGIKKRSDYSRTSAGSPHEHLRSPTTNKLDIPRSAKISKTSANDQNYRASNLIKFFNYKYNNGNSMEVADTVGTTSTETSISCYTPKTTSPRAPRSHLHLTDTTSTISHYSDRVLFHKQDSIQSHDSFRSPSPRQGRRSSTPNREVMPALGTPLSMIGSGEFRSSGYQSNLSSLPQTRNGLSRTRSHMELSKNDSKSSDNIKDLLDTETTGGDKSRTTSPTSNQIYSPLCVTSYSNSCSRRESFDNLYTRTMPRIKKNSFEKERPTVCNNPDFYQCPILSSSTSENVTLSDSKMGDSYKSINHNCLEMVRITRESAFDLISASRRLRFFELDLRKVQTSIRAYDEHFQVDKRVPQYNHNNNSNRTYVNRQYSIPTTYIPLTNRDSSYKRASFANRSANSSMEDIMENISPSSTSGKLTLYTYSGKDRFNLRKRVQSTEDEKFIDKNSMTRSTSLHSLRDEPQSPIIKSSRYTPTIHSSSYLRKSSKESLSSVPPYISVYKQDRTTHYKATEYSN